MAMKHDEVLLLKSWKLKIAVLASIVVPTITATGAFYKLELKLSEKNQEVEQRVSQLELNVERNFADKHTMESLRSDVSQLKGDVVEIKTLLKSKLK